MRVRSLRYGGGGGQRLLASPGGGAAPLALAPAAADLPFANVRADAMSGGARGDGARADPAAAVSTPDDGDSDYVRLDADAFEVDASGEAQGVGGDVDIEGVEDEAGSGDDEDGPDGSLIMAALSVPGAFQAGLASLGFAGGSGGRGSEDRRG